MANETILIVDDEIGIRELLSEILADERYQVAVAEDAEEARQYRLQHEPDLVLLDIWMPQTDGVTLLKEWVEQDLLTMPVVMMSGHGTIETAVEATRIGAIDFLEKPISLQKLLDTISKALLEGAPRLPSQPMQSDEATQSPCITLPIDGNMTAFPLPLDIPLKVAHEYFDAMYFSYHLSTQQGNVSKVAECVGLERTHLYRKLKQLGIKANKKNG